MRIIYFKRALILSIYSILVFGTSIYSYADTKAKMSVLSFSEDPTDLTANLAGSTVYDQNGDKCALIKVRTTEKNFAFDTGMMSPIDVQYDVKKHPGEIWVYVPFGIKKLTIQHALLGLIDYPIKIQIKRAHTYVMELVTDRVITTVQKRLNSQYLVFRVTPENAVVTINRKIVKTKNGCAWAYMKFGKYQWSVTAGKNYLSQKGTVTVSDSKSATYLTVNLEPLFGSVRITAASSAMNGASVYIDGDKIGTVPVDSIEVQEGEHELLLVKEGFKPKTQNIQVDKKKEIVITAEMEPDNCPVELIGDKSAIIYVDGTEYGVSSWSGLLPSGTHVIKTTKEDCNDSEQVIDIVASSEPLKIYLEKPEVKKGAICVNMEPSGATVYINGRRSGRTPYIQENVPVGKYSIMVTNLNCRTHNEDIFVEEGKTASVLGVLDATVDILLKSNVKNARFTIDDDIVAYTGEIVTLVTGKHDVKVNAQDYYSKSQHESINLDTKTMKVRLGHRIDVAGGLAIAGGGIMNESVLSRDKDGAGAMIGLDGYFSIGNAQNFFNVRINASPSLTLWESKPISIICPLTCGLRFRFGRPNFNFFLEPEFGYNCVFDTSNGFKFDDALSTHMFGGRTGFGFGAVDLSFGYYFSCLDKTVYVDQIRPLYWSFGLVFNFNYK